jgi:hypothetical protein
MGSYSKIPGKLGSTCLGMVLLAGCSHSDQAARTSAPAASVPVDISIPGTGIFPESLTSSSDGSVYIGSVGKGQVYRVAPGMTVAAPFIAPGTGGIKQVFGVFADDRTGTLWACSNVVGGGPPGGATGPSALHGFDLKSGAPKASYPLPSGSFCNDIAVGADGDVYASDTNAMQVLRLPQGGTALEAWSPAGAFGPSGGAVDGVAVVGGRVIVGTLLTSKLFAVEIGSDGKAGHVTELKLSAPITRPDGIRSWGQDLLSTDGSGKIQRVVIDGDSATVTTVKDGLDGVVAVTVIGNTGYALEGQLGIMMAQPGTTAPAEKPYRAVAFTLP